MTSPSDLSAPRPQPATRSSFGIAMLDFVALSAASLLLELSLIRYLSAEIRIFAYFANLVLVTCFLGLGLGYAISKPKLSLAVSIAGTALLVLCAEPATSRVVPFREISELLSFSDLNTWVDAESEIPRIALGVALLLALLMIVTVVFVPIGQALGAVFEKASADDRLELYSWNVAASLLGILGFQVLAALWLPPPIWLTLALGLLLIALRREPVTLLFGIAALVGCTWLTGGADRPERRVYWSPYQKLEVEPLLYALRAPDGTIEKTRFFGVTVNSTAYQYLLDFRPETLDARPATFPPERRGFLYYDVPYRFVPRPRSVLIVGSGTGNDVAAALRNGAEHVDAVEIDPTILEIGRILHPENPYGDPRVTTVIDDARAFFHRTERRYDLVVFGLLDAHRLTSNFSNTSLDSYVYTLESFRAVRDLLTDDGIMSVSFQVARRFIGNRLEESLSQVFGKRPITLLFREATVALGTGGAIFLSGGGNRIEETLAASQELQKHHVTLAPPAGGYIELATDDWPYLYVEERSIPMLWRIVGVVVLAGVITSLIPIGLKGGRIDGVFFFLGFAFMLLETQTISRFALAFGATASVSAAVIAGILVMILIGNALVARSSVRPTWSLFIALAATALAGAWISIDQLAAASPLLRTAALAVTVAPLLFAAIAFARAFEATLDARGALLSNLIGAVAGGLAQCLSFVVGQRALVFLVILSYASAWALGLGRVGTTPSTRA